ncbi:hypothetical protein Vadar_007855 [Vaccinium darrowii]|uniref:Uncharacterized protein n=1 Tax=Vaccinium darrowii TaxID=229202 RepID=A0ACB7YCA1_9ERIC|nr:hypothetical protein Vadar_007855 [Vaccinium darrowii]
MKQILIFWGTEVCIISQGTTTLSRAGMFSVLKDCNGESNCEPRINRNNIGGLNDHLKPRSTASVTVATTCFDAFVQAVDTTKVKEELFWKGAVSTSHSQIMLIVYGDTAGYMRMLLSEAKANWEEAVKTPHLFLSLPLAAAATSHLRPLLVEADHNCTMEAVVGHPSY